MMFRNREAARIFALRQELFSHAASESLLRDGHHIGTGYENENICGSFRDEALEFFKTRRIKWHGGVSCDSSTVSSQVACLNCFFPFTSDSLALRCWLSKLYPDLDHVLPISSEAEPPLRDGKQPFLTFEWIGEKNYLNERWGNRGQNCTSVDVLLRFRTVDGRIHLVLAEWKYCERYEDRKTYIGTSSRGTDRVAIYRPQLDVPGSQIVLGTTQFADLFFEPFDQVRRLQFLASAMERSREMGADMVSVLHIAPRANEGLVNVALSKRIAPGYTVGEVWNAIAAKGRFSAAATEDFIPRLTQSGADPTWAEYIHKRYAAMV